MAILIPRLYLYTLGLGSYRWYPKLVAIFFESTGQSKCPFCFRNTSVIYPLARSDGLVVLSETLGVSRVVLLRVTLTLRWTFFWLRLVPCLPCLPPPDTLLCAPASIGKDPKTTISSSDTV